MRCHIEHRFVVYGLGNAELVCALLLGLNQTMKLGTQPPSIMWFGLVRFGLHSRLETSRDGESGVALLSNPGPIVVWLWLAGYWAPALIARMPLKLISLLWNSIPWVWAVLVRPGIAFSDKPYDKYDTSGDNRHSSHGEWDDAD